jgi:predicted kinase
VAKIHLIEGPVGAGKSTYAVALGHDLSAPHLDLDEWMVNLFRTDRPETGFMAWYLERKRRCIEQIWRVAAEIVGSGTDAVLELGLVGRRERAGFYERVDDADFELVVYVLETPEALRRQRVRERNRQKGGTFKMEVSDEIFEIANHAWEAPDASECRARSIQFVEAGRQRYQR